MSGDSIVVTGLAMMTGLGLNVQSSWEGIRDGVSATRRFSLFDPTGLSCCFGVELPSQFEQRLREIKPRNRRQMTRSTALTLLTAQDAVEDSGLLNACYDPARIGVVCGTTGPAYVPPLGRDEHRILRNMSNAPAAWISLKNKFAGPALAVGAACASGVYALHTACMLLDSHVCDAVVVGAGDSSLNYADVQGFCSLMALAERQDDYSRASRPFAKNRNGFVMAEGAGMLVLERKSGAQKRGARLYARTWLPGLVSETYNILAPRPAGAGMAACMRAALQNAGLETNDIDYINAHGTATIPNDRYETQAIKTVFGDQSARTPISSTKSTTGHALAGAAGIEMVVCCKALVDQMIPQTANLDEPDPACDLDYTPNASRSARLDHVLCNSFAFGGHNGACIFSRCA